MDFITTITTMSCMIKKEKGSAKKSIFMDYAASTPVSSVSLKAFMGALQYFANPQALHTQGLKAMQLLDKARRDIAQFLVVKSSEIIFTSGGTESNNLALAGHLLYLEKSGVNIKEKSIIISAIEHPSVREVLAPFEDKGMRVVRVNPTIAGEIRPDAVADMVDESTVLVSIALVNSEIGTVQPIHAIVKKIREKEEQLRKDGKNISIAIHTDASQGMYENMEPHGLGVDILTLDAGKIYAPRGVGALYVRTGIKISPVLLGGSQEGGLRPGTENTALASAFARACLDAKSKKEGEHARLESVRSAMISQIQDIFGDDVVVNGEAKKQSPHILNISIKDIDSEYVAMYMDQRGVALSTKSACLERSDSNVSSVVSALAQDEDSAWRATNTLRFSFGITTTPEHGEVAVQLLKEAVDTYKSFS